MVETTYKKGELLLDENVVVESADGSYRGICKTQMRLNQDVLIIEFNEIEYECKAIVNDFLGYMYGAASPDLSNYPFVLSNVVSGSSMEEAVITDTINLYTENPGTYNLKIYTAISDSDSSSEPITIRSYIDKNLTNLNWNILPQIFEAEGVKLTEKIKRYLNETPKNTNWNMMQTIISSSEDKMEVWFSSDTYEDNEGGRTFIFLDPDYTEHITELLANAENYRIYLNNEELLNFRRATETRVTWMNEDSPENATIGFTAMTDSHENIGAAIYFKDSSIAPTSVEIAVKQK